MVINFKSCMEKLIRKLREHDIDVDVVSDQLNLNIPDGLDAGNIIEEVRANKAELISFIKKMKAASNFKGIEPAPKSDHYVLSSAQKRLYFLNRFDQSSIAYNMPQITHLNGKPDKEKLSAALHKLVARHESLRTSFVVVNDEPVQKIADDVKIELEYYEADEDQVADVIRRFVRPFNLVEAPLFRAGIIERADSKGTSHDDHIFMIDMHHIIGDGVSLDILVQDFMTFYHGGTLPELRLQYKDYAVWQQGEYQKELLDKKEFWLNEFKDEVPVLELPTDFIRPITKSYAGGKTGFELAKEETEQLRQIAEKEGSTMFMVMLSLYNILFSKIGDKEDIVVGTSTVGRQHADIENIIGVFINTVPLRNYPKRDLTFKAFLADVKTRSLASFDNQAYPYEALIEELNVARDISRNPLFETFFQYNYVNKQSSDSATPKAASQSISSTEIVSKFDISMRASEHDGKIRCIIEYATALFRQETIEKMISYFRKIVNAVLHNPEIKLSDIEIITDAEKQQLLGEFNDTEVSYPKEASIVSLFEDQVKANPEGIALSIEGKEFTYLQINEHANAIAGCLREKYHVKSGDLVGLLLERDQYLIPSILGVLKSGGAYVPLDPEYPIERIQYIAQDSGIELLLTAPDLSGIYQQLENITAVDISAIEVSGHKEAYNVASDDMAYMIYTSGSSGQPKGVMIEHRNVVNFVTGVTNKIHFDSERAILCHTTISFDIFVLETILPLLNGMKIVLATNNDQKDPAALVKLIQSQHIEYLQITPSQLKLLLASGHNENILNSIKTLMVGGEAFSEDLLLDLKKQYNGLIYNMYGPTETTVWSTIHDLTYSNTVSIGKPIANTFVRIIDSQGNLVPVGVNGELCIGGEGVARSYWKREELTKQKFIKDPVNKKDIIYRTGDLAKWLSDGTIRFVGRIDNQVKIRGHRIELGEVEFQLAKLEGIAESAVIVNEKGGDKHLAAYYVATGNVVASDIREFLLKKLPEYMVPSVFIPIDAMPLTPNKKIDRKALRTIEMAVGDDHVAPATEVEEKLVEIWSEVLLLNPEQIGVTKSFFELGGHSLNAVTVVNKIYNAFNVEYSLRELFFNPTIKAIAENVETRKWLDDGENENDSATKEILI